MIYTENNHIWSLDNTVKTVTINMGEWTFTNPDLISQSLILTESINSSTNLNFLNVEGNSVEFILNNQNQLIKDIVGKVFTVHVQAQNGGLTSLIPYGTFIAEHPVRVTDNQMRVRGYDFTSKLKQDISPWLGSLTYPVTLRNLLVGLCDYVGLEHEIPDMFTNSDMPIQQTINSTGLLGTELMGWIQEASATFWKVNRYGKVARLPLSDILYPDPFLYPHPDVFPSGGVSETRSGGNYISLNVADYEIATIDKVIVRTEEFDIGIIVGEGTNAYIIEGNPLLYTNDLNSMTPYVENLYGNITPIKYVPSDIESVGLPYITAGDKIKVVTVKGYEFETYIFSRTLKGLEGLKDSLESQGDYLRPVNNSVHRSIVQLQGRSNVLKRDINETRSSLVDLENNVESEFLQQASEIALKVNSNGVISAINLSPETIRISASKINIDGVVTFSDLETAGATEINGANITTGYISADRISGGTIEGIDIYGATIYWGSGSTLAELSQTAQGTPTLYGYRNVILEAGDGVLIEGGSLVSIQGDRTSVSTSEFTINCPITIQTGGDWSYLRSIETHHIYDYTAGNHNIGSSSQYFNGIYYQSLVPSSDIRLKENIEPFQDYEWLRDMNVYTYNFKVDNPEELKIGIIANEHEHTDYAKYVIVGNSEHGMLSIRQDNIIMGMLKYLQEVDKRVTALEEK